MADWDDQSPPRLGPSSRRLDFDPWAVEDHLVWEDNKADLDLSSVVDLFSEAGLFWAVEDPSSVLVDNHLDQCPEWALGAVDLDPS